jgi:beta-lactam-binding protein with PASTA domain
MKFRRRFATGGRLREFFAALRTRAGDDIDDSAPPELESSAEAAPVTAAEHEDHETVAVPAAGHSDLATRWRSWAARHPLLVAAAGMFAGTFVVGYLLAALVLFPAPIFATHHAVPRVLGLEQERAQTTLTDAGFTLGAVQRAPHASIPAGSVIWQDPPAEVNAIEATAVSLTISSGPQRVPVPDVAGYDAADARTLIEAAGLRVGSTESTQAPTPRNVAVNTRPPAGATLPPGADVVLVVSVGAATVRVPSLTGLTVDEARLALETAGLALGTVFSQTTTAVAPGEIFHQEPGAGTLSAPGTVVNVRLARSL